MMSATHAEIRLHAVRGRGRRSVRRLVARMARLARRRSLLGDILVRQLVIALLVGLAALAALWWTSSSVIQDDMRRRAELWLYNLDELGMPLHVAGDSARFTRIEDYLSRFDEIAYVRYYSASGERIFSDSLLGGDTDVAPLDPSSLAEISSRSNEGDRYFLEADAGGTAVMRLAKPMWARSLRADGLLGFDVRTSAIDETLVGYVEVGLNFTNTRSQLVWIFGTAVLIGATAFVLLMAGWWMVGRRALLPLLEMQAPLRMLAHGKRNVSVAPNGHWEISSIADALNATVTAVNERDEALARLANYDPLTGLCNRQRFLELLESEIRQAGRGRKSALLFVDLDRFRYANEAFGHAAGDQLLKFAAARLVEIIRPQDTAARFGGDQFMILLPDVGRKQAATVAQEIVAGMQDEQVMVGDQPLSARASVGVTMLRGARSSSAEVLGEAEAACRQAKANGRNRFHSYDGSSDAAVETAADSDWLPGIQRALKEDRFVLHFQPIVDIRSCKTTYHEVLLRMRGDDEKLVPPATFLPVAERFGLMADIDRWVVRHAIRSLAAQRAAHGDVRFTLNVSGGTFDSESFFDCVLQEHRENDVPLEALVIEITEQVAVRNVVEAGTQIAELVRRGARFAIDDFGSGYCSYGYLRALPVEFVKIDGSFIRGLVNSKVDQRIVVAIGEVARAAGAMTIAEHVEDHETFALLGKLGVDFAQGYFVGKPSPAIGNESPQALASRRMRAATRATPRRTLRPATR